jgi:general L-amino acid transport system permease protein
MLTIVVATAGIVASFPIGILLALGRQSKMPVIRFLSVVYIEAGQYFH